MSSERLSSLDILKVSLNMSAKSEPGSSSVSLKNDQSLKEVSESVESDNSVAAKRLLFSLM